MLHEIHEIHTPPSISDTGITCFHLRYVSVHYEVYIEILPCFDEECADSSIGNIENDDRSSIGGKLECAKED